MFPHDSGDFPRSDSNKDSRFKAIVAGYFLPALILVVVIANFTVGRVYLPADRNFSGDVFDGLVQSSPIGWRFAGVVMAKIGLAVGIFAWHALANHDCTEHLTHYGLLVSAILMIGGLIVLSLSWFI